MYSCCCCFLTWRRLFLFQLVQIGEKMSVNSPGVEFLRTVTKFRERKKNSSSCVCVLYQASHREDLSWRQRNLSGKVYCTCRFGLFLVKPFPFYEVPSTGIRPDISLWNRIYIFLISSPKPLSRVIFRDLTELRVGVDDWNRIIAVSSASCPNSCVRGLLFSLLFSGCWRC